jgi:exopolysaccharide production protein ExoY
VSMKPGQAVALPISHYDIIPQSFVPHSGGSPDRSGGISWLYRDRLKRCMDLMLVVLVAPILVVVVGLLALVMLFNGGQPFYVQARVGRNGRIFRMWKLRSMIVDADQKLEAHLAADPAARLEWDTSQKLKDDPRITHFGNVLRKTSLDELPQFWNVLTGNMSLVGPRPMMPCQRNLYFGDAYYRLRPGITGPWQVSLRHKTTFADRARYDLQYEATLSFQNDLRVLIKTIRVVCARTGC